MMAGLALTWSVPLNAWKSAVIDALRANLMDSEDVREFVKEFTAEWNVRPDVCPLVGW